MTHTSESSSQQHESMTTITMERERLILPPISSMDGFYNTSRSWPPPATTLPTSSNNNAGSNDNLVSPASSSSYMSMQETLPSPGNNHPHHQPRPDYFTTSNSSNSTTATTPTYSMDSSNNHLIQQQQQQQQYHRDHHYRQNSLPQLSSFRKNSINSILSQPSSSSTTTNTPVFRYKSNHPSSPITSNYATTSVNILSPSSSSSSTTPSLRNIENDIDEVIKHCNSLADNMNHKRGSIVENDHYFNNNPALMRPWLDDMISRANEVLNALLRLRKHQLAAEHARLHKTDHHLQRGSEDEVFNWDATNNTMTSSNSGGSLMTLNSVRQKKRGKRPTLQNRCHSCNISETPEWRRGPDGARTLCNACGLHYAKLAKKVKQEDEAAKKEMMEDKDDTSMK